MTSKTFIHLTQDKKMMYELWKHHWRHLTSPIERAIMIAAEARLRAYEDVALFAINKVRNINNSKSKDFEPLVADAMQALQVEHEALESYKNADSLNHRQLVEEFELSQAWIDRIGTPDWHVRNPVDPRFAPMRLWTRRRVEEYIEAHADEYNEYLDRRRARTS